MLPKDFPPWRAVHSRYEYWCKNGSFDKALAHLNKMNQILGKKSPWNLTYSYGRALQSSALKAWAGDSDNISIAQDAFYKRAKLNGLATSGDYDQSME